MQIIDLVAAVSPSDGIGIDDVAAWCAAVMTICAFIYWLLKPIRAIDRHWTHLHEDLYGTEARKGVERRPGALEIIRENDRRLSIMEEQLEHYIPFLEELAPNGGGSVKDRVARIEKVLRRAYPDKFDD